MAVLSGRAWAKQRGRLEECQGRMPRCFSRRPRCAVPRPPLGGAAISVQASKAVRRAIVLTHGKAQTIGPALARLETVARDAGVELVVAADDGVEEADLAVV